MRKKERMLVFRLTGGRCAYCGCKLDIEDFHVDHIVPKCHGGGERAENLVAACPDCNMSKGDLSVEQFREKIKRLSNPEYMTSKVKMVFKYYHVKRKPVVFYFENLPTFKEV